MLGTRHFGKAKLDLWVGSPFYFYCDACLAFKGDFQKFESFVPQSTVKPENLMVVTPIEDLQELRPGSGHLAFCPRSGMSPQMVFDHLEGYVLSVHSGRLTIILNDLDEHDQFFSEFSRRFP